MRVAASVFGSTRSTAPLWVSSTSTASRVIASAPGAPPSRIDGPCARPSTADSRVKGPVAAVGDPDRAEADRDVLRVAPDRQPPADDDVLARVDARDRPVTRVHDPDVVGADRERGREVAGADGRPSTRLETESMRVTVPA